MTRGLKAACSNAFSVPCIAAFSINELQKPRSQSSCASLFLADGVDRFVVGAPCSGGGSGPSVGTDGATRNVVTLVVLTQPRGQAQDRNGGRTDLVRVVDAVRLMSGKKGK